jgi:methylated-DNA-protein-cysteine methyltransferase-like protein
MPKQKSQAFTRIRAEVIRLVSLIPEGKFTTYGSIAIHMNVVPRHVATVISHLTEKESATLPWHRVVSTNARISQNMPTEIASVQQARLQAEGLFIDAKGYIKNADNHFHVVGVRREIRWSDPD